MLLAESGILCFGIQNPTIQNPSSIYKDWNPVPGIWNPRHGIQNPKTACLGFLSWGETTMHIVSKPGYDH